MTSEENNKEINPVYEEGDFVVYPAHGVGYVIGIVGVKVDWIYYKRLIPQKGLLGSKPFILS